MPKPETHTQCSLRSPTGGEMISWIPTKIAKVGNTVRLKDDEGNWTAGWKVAKTYATMPSPDVNERSRDYTRTREASDI